MGSTAQCVMGCVVSGCVSVVCVRSVCVWVCVYMCVCVCVCTSRLWICSFSSLFSSCSVFSAISSSGPKQCVIGQRAADQPSAACLATIFSTLFSDRPKGGAAHSRGSLLGQTHTTQAPHATPCLKGFLWRESGIFWLSCKVSRVRETWWSSGFHWVRSLTAHLSEKVSLVKQQWSA